MKETPLPFVVFMTIICGLPVVALLALHIPAEGGEFFVYWIDVHDVCGAAVDLQAVVIDEGDHMIKAIVGSGHRCFPNLAFFDLTVAQKRVHIAVALVELFRERHADGSRNAGAERAGGHIHAWHLAHVGMALELTAELAQGFQFFGGKKAAFSECCIEPWRCVSL